MDGYKQFQKVKAKFSPKRMDDLQEGFAEHVGNTYDFTALWIIEDGPYEGRWAFRGDIHFAPGWVPECDLEIVSEEV